MYLFFSGIKASRARVVSFYKSLLVVGIFSFFSISGIAKLELSYFLYMILLIVLGASCYLGWIHVANKRIFIDRKKMLIFLPGSWITLALVLIIFASKYYLGYKCFKDSLFLLSLKAKLLSILSSGFSSGLIFGRFINYIYRFKVDKHVELSKNNEFTG
jgi:hypothetical protein